MKNCECGAILERQEKAMFIILECPDCLHYETVEETERNKQLQRDWAEVKAAQESTLVTTCPQCGQSSDLQTQLAQI